MTYVTSKSSCSNLCSRLISIKPPSIQWLDLDLFRTQAIGSSNSLANWGSQLIYTPTIVSFEIKNKNWVLHDRMLIKTELKENETKHHVICRVRMKDPKLQISRLNYH
ncbi:hypothetical protein VNO77_21515 [Canavalia gladiata]|uniref:Uncharacterized protein n=1 Tax=Canavalia gladiata TaxID=3824 RepID=A0AAN9QMD5_CANGL